MQIQSFSFYDDTYVVFGTSYINPISSQGLKTYHYRTLDTIASEKPSYMIYYFPKKNQETAGLEGVLYIDTKSYALQKAIAQLKAVVDVKASQDFTFIEKENIWFPLKKEIHIKKGGNR